MPSGAFGNPDARGEEVKPGFLTVLGGAGVPIYLAGWLLIPEEGTGQSIAAQFTQSRHAG